LAQEVNWDTYLMRLQLLFSFEAADADVMVSNTDWVQSIAYMALTYLERRHYNSGEAVKHERRE